MWVCPGHSKVLGEGQCPLQVKVSAIAGFPSLSTNKEHQRFLVVGYRSFCPNFSTVVSPLTYVERFDKVWKLVCLIMWLFSFFKEGCVTSKSMLCMFVCVFRCRLEGTGPPHLTLVWRKVQCRSGCSCESVIWSSTACVTLSVLPGLNTLLYYVTLTFVFLALKCFKKNYGPVWSPFCCSQRWSLVLCIKTVGSYWPPVVWSSPFSIWPGTQSSAWGSDDPTVSHFPQPDGPPAFSEPQFPEKDHKLRSLYLNELKGNKKENCVIIC